MSAARKKGSATQKGVTDLAGCGCWQRIQGYGPCRAASALVGVRYKYTEGMQHKRVWLTLQAVDGQGAAAGSASRPQKLWGHICPGGPWHSQWPL